MSWNKEAVWSCLHEMKKRRRMNGYEEKNFMF